MLKYDSQKYGVKLLEDIRTHFKQKTGNSMSCGIGKTVSESIQNLDLAKSHGKDQIKDSKVHQDGN